MLSITYKYTKNPTIKYRGFLRKDWHKELHVYSRARYSLIYFLNYSEAWLKILTSASRATSCYCYWQGKRGQNPCSDPIKVPGHGCGSPTSHGARIALSKSVYHSKIAISIHALLSWTVGDECATEIMSLSSGLYHHGSQPIGILIRAGSFIGVLPPAMRLSFVFCLCSPAWRIWADGHLIMLPGPKTDKIANFCCALHSTLT